MNSSGMMVITNFAKIHFDIEEKIGSLSSLARGGMTAEGVVKWVVSLECILDGRHLKVIHKGLEGGRVG